MHFIYPEFLWALFTALIPVVIHLFTFRRYKTVYFSNVSFLQNIQKESRSRSRLKNLLLLLIRVLAIVFLVLFFAKPMITKNSNEVASKQKVVAMYIDNSYSMEADGKFGKLLEFAKMKAVEIANFNDLNTLFLLTTNDFELKHQKFVNREQFVDWVTQIKPSHISMNFEQVYNHQNYLLKKIDSLASVRQYIFSDFQKNAFDIDYYPEKSKVRTVFVPLKHQNLKNVFIDSLWFGSPGHFLSKQEKLFVRVKNNAEDELLDLQVNLFINDSLKAISNESFLANESKVLEMPFVQTKTGWNKAKVELSDYPITFDNSLDFSYFINDRIPMLEINKNDSFSHLLALFNDDERFLFESSVNDGSFYSELSNKKVIFINQLTELSTGLINVLETAYNNGSKLIIIPPAQGNIDAYNRLLDLIGSPVLENWNEEQGQMQGVNLNHVYFKDAIKPINDNIRLPDYNGYYLIKRGPTSNSTVLFKSESGNPIVIEGSTGKGSYMLLTLPLSGEITSLPTHPIFVPLFYNSALYSVRFGELYHIIDHNLVVNVNLNLDGNIELYDSINSLRHKPKFINVLSTTRLFLAESDLLAGHTHIMQNDEIKGIVSFAYSRKESEMDFFGEQELNEYINKMPTKTIGLLKADNFNLYKEVKQQERKKDLSQIILWLVVLAVISEVGLLRLMQ